MNKKRYVFLCPAILLSHMFLPFQMSIMRYLIQSHLRKSFKVTWRLDRPDLKTYARRQKADRPNEGLPSQSPSSNQVSEQQSSSSLDQILNISLYLIPPKIQLPSLYGMMILNLPIVSRKGVRKCTKYPISNYLLYSSLLSSYQSFVSSLYSIRIPQNWQEAVVETNGERQ